jgi:2-oxoglutarate ferredoxin oxidoreductase subunit beta
VRQHDGSYLKLRKLDRDYDPTNRVAAMDFLQTHHARGEIVTGLLYVDPDAEDMHSLIGTAKRPLNEHDDAALCPGSAALERLNASLR